MNEFVCGGVTVAQAELNTSDTHYISKLNGTDKGVWLNKIIICFLKCRNVLQWDYQVYLPNCLLLWIFFFKPETWQGENMKSTQGYNLFLKMIKR
jgi:hypothetical protein